MSIEGRITSNLIEKLQTRIVIFEGNDGCGKDTLIANLTAIQNAKTSDTPLFEFRNRGRLTPMTLTYQTQWDENLEGLNVILRCPPEISFQRCSARSVKTGVVLDKYEKPTPLFNFDRVYLALAIHYELPIFDSHALNPTQLAELVWACLNDPRMMCQYCMRNPNRCLDEQIGQLPVLARGNSKVILELSNDLVCIYFIDTIHSFKAGIAEFVPGTGAIRLRSTRAFLTMLNKHAINHSFLYVGDRYIVAMKVPNASVPPVEIVVKSAFVGSDKHRYYGLNEIPTRSQAWTNSSDSNANASRQADVNRFLYNADVPLPDAFKRLDVGAQLNFASPVNYSGGTLNSPPLVNPQSSAYDVPMVRFDWRNPNVTSEGIHLQDQTLYSPLANYYINTDNASHLALRAFHALRHFLLSIGILIQDICFFMDVDGKTILGEISSDNGRYKDIRDGDRFGEYLTRALTSSESLAGSLEGLSKQEQQNTLNYILSKQAFPAGHSEVKEDEDGIIGLIRQQEYVAALRMSTMHTFQRIFNSIFLQNTYLVGSASSDLDKDVWRRGGDRLLVVSRWGQLASRVEEAVMKTAFMKELCNDID